MEKYNELALLTKRFLDGELQKLTVEYKNSELLEVNVCYEFNHIRGFNYKICFDKSCNKVEFIYHKCISSTGNSVLKRESNFESAIENFFASKPNLQTV